MFIVMHFWGIYFRKLLIKLTTLAFIFAPKWFQQGAARPQTPVRFRFTHTI